MSTEKQQYPKINCVQVKKAKTTTLKLFDEKYQKDQSFQKKRNEQKRNSLVINSNQNHAGGFQYLKGSLPNQKSFELIIKESRRILEERQKLQFEHKRLQTLKKAVQSKKKSKKKQVTEKKQRKGKRKQQKGTDVQQEIVLEQLDKQKFDKESEPTKNLIEKIKFLQNIASKCNIMSSCLFDVKNHSQSLKISQEQKQYHYLNSGSLLELQKLEIQIKLLQKNISGQNEMKNILSIFQIEQLSKLQVQNRKNKCSLSKKYIDKQNLNLQADNLEKQLKQMQAVLFEDENLSL